MDVYNGGYESVEAYNQNGRGWCMGIRLWNVHTTNRLNTIVYSYKADEYWIACFDNGIDKSIPENVNCQFMHIYYTGNHFDVVTSIQRRVRS